MYSRAFRMLSACSILSGVALRGKKSLVNFMQSTAILCASSISFVTQCAFSKNFIASSSVIIILLHVVRPREKIKGASINPPHYTLLL